MTKAGSEIVFVRVPIVSQFDDGMVTRAAIADESEGKLPDEWACFRNSVCPRMPQ